MLLYVEPESEGHHLALYAASIWKKLIEEGWRISWLTSHHAVHSEIAVELIGQFGGNLEVHPCELATIPSSGERPLAWLRYQMEHRRMLNEAIPRIARSRPIDLIFMPWLNYCDRACGIFGLPPVNIPISALHMHVSIHESPAANATWMRRASLAVTKRAIARLYSDPRLKNVAVVLESFVEFARSERIPGWQKLTYVPDVGSLETTPPHGGNRAFYPIAQDQTVVLAFGAMTKRKGIEILLNAVGALGNSSRVVVLLAGKQDNETRAQVADFKRRSHGSHAQIMVQDAFVSSADEQRLFSVADIVWVGYPGFLGSSGVLNQAGCAGIPVIAGNHGEIGRIVQRSRCGLACDLTIIDEVAAAIRTLAGDRNLRVQLGANGWKRSLQHTPEIFAGNIHRLIQAAAGLPCAE